jgi:hypothetical protein
VIWILDHSQQRQFVRFNRDSLVQASFARLIFVPSREFVMCGNSEERSILLWLCSIKACVSLKYHTRCMLGYPYLGTSFPSSTLSMDSDVCPSPSPCRTVSLHVCIEFISFMTCQDSVDVIEMGLHLPCVGLTTLFRRGMLAFAMTLRGGKMFDIFSSALLGALVWSRDCKGMI